MVVIVMNEEKVNQVSKNNTEMCFQRLPRKIREDCSMLEAVTRRCEQN